MSVTRDCLSDSVCMRIWTCPQKRQWKVGHLREVRSDLSVSKEKERQSCWAYDYTYSSLLHLIHSRFLGNITGIVGSYCVSDKIRGETKSVIMDLNKKGIEITMLTGDQSKAALGVAQQIGLEEADVKSDLLPEEKLVAIQD